jgi:hypothetical protein
VYFIVFGSNIASYRQLSSSRKSLVEGWSEPFPKVCRGCQRGEVKLTGGHPFDARISCPPLTLKRVLEHPSSTWCGNTVSRATTQIHGRPGASHLDKIEVAMEFAEEFATKIS